MPVTITVSQVREAMYLGAGGSSATGGGSPSTAQLGQWFHEIVAGLLGDDERTNAVAALADAEPNLEAWKEALAARAYGVGVGPRLTAHRAALHDVAEGVESLWTAVRSACDWLAELAWSIATTTPGGTKRVSREAAWRMLGTWMESERPLECVLREPHWSDSVKLVGIADALLRLVETGRWCAIEFKLGKTSPEIDLGQACLYHLMLSPQEGTADTKSILNGVVSRDEGTLALIRFLPERHEALFSASQLADARRELIALIGGLAGVDQPLEIAPKPSDCLARPTDAHRELGRRLIAAFAEYGVTVSLNGEPIAGPTFLRFPLEMGRGTKVGSIERRTAELQVRLGLKVAPFIKIESGNIVVDVERPDRQTVMFADVRSQLPEPDLRLGNSRVPIGVDLKGRLHFADFAKTDNAHMLVAGTTGSGKSEWLRLAVAGLILTNTPEQLRFLIIDPKRNAFHALRDSPYLWRPIIFPDETSAGQVLKELGDEMDRRYTLFDGADSIAQLATRTNTPLPRIVCVCDEYYDLINRNRTERLAVEQQVCRLGAKARAAGIHLILATQQPSRQTIKGALDSNIPSRVGLKMQKALESQMLLTESGAERLLGHGDLLFRDVGPLQRLQAPYIPEEERNAIFGKR